MKKILLLGILLITSCSSSGVKDLSHDRGKLLETYHDVEYGYNYNEETTYSVIVNDKVYIIDIENVFNVNERHPQDYLNSFYVYTHEQLLIIYKKWESYFL